MRVQLACMDVRHPLADVREKRQLEGIVYFNVLVHYDVLKIEAANKQHRERVAWRMNYWIID